MDRFGFCRMLFEETRYMNLAIKETLADVIKRHDLNHFQAHLLGDLHSEDGQPIRQLADHICVKPSNFTPLVHSLEERGLIERRQDEKDKRSYRIYLTPEGRAKSEAIDKDFAQLFGGDNAQASELQQQVLAGFKAFRQLAEMGSAPASGRGQAPNEE